MGLPLIVGDTGWQSMEYLNLKDNIVILDKDDINENNIRFNMNRILSDQSICEEMSKGALEVTNEWLNWDVLIEKTLRYNQK
jgi:glycosyltransferase involved in cell wall biosynthesis